jgi:2-amino-4-hydroxy-6-hydroxymethyldihydropteridine diphosphokinase
VQPLNALLLLGGNEGDPLRHLDEAAILLADERLAVLARSRDHWTEPVGFQDHRLFLNRALLVSTDRTPLELLRHCLAVEQRLGRVRRADGLPAARTIDIDILFHGDHVESGPHLLLPHPRMHLRHFALAPAADIVPQWGHPVLGRSVLQLLDDLRGPQ